MIVKPSITAKRVMDSVTFFLACARGLKLWDHRRGGSFNNVKFRVRVRGTPEKENYDTDTLVHCVEDALWYEARLKCAATEPLSASLATLSRSSHHQPQLICLRSSIPS